MDRLTIKNFEVRDLSQSEKKKKKEKSKIIKKNYLPNFQGKPYKVTKSERQYFTSDLHLLKNQLGQAQRLFDIAQSRDILTKDISVKS